MCCLYCIFMFISLKIMCHFSLSILNIFLLFYGSFIVMCLCVFLKLCLGFVAHFELWLRFNVSFVRFSATIFLNIPLVYSLHSPFWDSLHILDLLNQVPHISYSLLSIFQTSLCYSSYIFKIYLLIYWFSLHLCLIWY